MVNRVPLLSVLIPSRWRVNYLKDSILSFGDGDAEFLVAVDEDDPELEDYYKLQDEMEFSLIITKRYGYAYLERYYNDLARISNGKWLLLWNDDATIGEHWEKILKKEDHNMPWIAQFGPDHCFPILSRQAYNIMGHFSMGPSNDTYLLGVADRSERRLYLDSADITHIRDYLHDQTEGDKVQAAGQTSKRMNSEECIDNQIADARAIVQWLKMN